jgi:septal ring factor EnvC (AmiA/AmiB activator)
MIARAFAGLLLFLTPSLLAQEVSPEAIQLLERATQRVESAEGELGDAKRELKELRALLLRQGKAHQREMATAQKNHEQARQQLHREMEQAQQNAQREMQRAQRDMERSKSQQEQQVERMRGEQEALRGALQQELERARAELEAAAEELRQEDARGAGRRVQQAQGRLQAAMTRAARDGGDCSPPRRTLMSRAKAAVKPVEVAVVMPPMPALAPLAVPVEVVVAAPVAPVAPAAVDGNPSAVCEPAPACPATPPSPCCAPKPKAAATLPAPAAPTERVIN